MLERWLFPFPQGASQQFSGEIEKFMRFFQPHEVPGFQKRRYGAKADGGYVMLDDFGPVRTAVSLGIGQEDSWDRDITRSFLHPQFFQRHSITPMTLFDPTCFSADGAAIAFPNDVESHYRHGRA